MIGESQNLKIHLWDLENYIREIISSKTNQSCQAYNKTCFNLINHSDESFDYTVTTYFDLVIVDQWVDIRQIKEWVDALNFCKISEMQLIPSFQHDQTEQEIETLQVTINLSPCRLRSF